MEPVKHLPLLTTVSRLKGSNCLEIRKRNSYTNPALYDYKKTAHLFPVVI